MSQPIPVDGDDASASKPVPPLCIVSFDYLRRAIRDPVLDRGHLKVLAHLSERYNGATLMAWPSRQSIGAAEGLDAKTVGNRLYELRKRGYIDWARLRDPKRPNRTLVHYWWQEAEIADAVRKLREIAESARPAGQHECRAELPAAGSARPTVLQTALPGGFESALPAGCKELVKKGTRRAEARPRVHDVGRAPPKPHMNGVGFVISDEHGLIIPAETVARWEEEFPHLDHLEVRLQRLAICILRGGPKHLGWFSPEHWIASCLAEDDQKAERAARREEAGAATKPEPLRMFRR